VIQASEIIDATKSIALPDYDTSTLDNDFALIKLERAAQATPIAMDSNELSGSYTTAKKLWPVGFGNTQTNGDDYPKKLNHVSVSYVPNDTCNSAYDAGSITSNMMCAADLNEDSCQGDSGTMMIICMSMISIVLIQKYSP
jgi:trypsin